jgi:predicted lipoprotein with Yx(FWY)xxD motif
VNDTGGRYVVQVYAKNLIISQNGEIQMRNRWLAVAGLAVATAALAACGSSAASTPTSGSGSSSAPAAASASGIKTVSTSHGTVLASSAGHTLYWFAIDTPAKSNCNGQCASYWPPVPASAKAAAGVSLPDAFGSVKRDDGSRQLSYDGHPLYTYTGDTAAGQVNGNGISASGGLWWAMTPSGAKLAAAKPASSSSTGSGGTGY